MKKIIIILATVFIFSLVNGFAGQNIAYPNIIIILADDLGYSDIGCFGAKRFKTPHLDNLAAEGIRLTSFYVSSPVCSPSRAALMTGSFHPRVGIQDVLYPNSNIGINSNVMTIGEIVKQRGYKTAIIGKWHLGDQVKFLPGNHGFDYYFGLPYSNDMSSNQKNNHRKSELRFPPLPLVRDDNIVEYEPDQSQLVSRYTNEAIRFIEKCKGAPFLLYFAHNAPHVPLFLSKSWKGATGNGIYADVIAEIDWSVGMILSTLKKLNLDDNTLIIFTSDNGPWKVFGNHGGTCEPLRGSKGTTWEGGIRVPFIARWPKKIAPDSFSDQPVATIDILPTIANLIGAKLPEHKIDGKDIWIIMSGEKISKSPHDSLFFYNGLNELQAMRAGKWKIHFPHSYIDVKKAGKDGLPGTYETRRTGLELYDLSIDISEKKNVALQYPEIIANMQEKAESIRKDLGDSLTKK
jgi:arylsulfatase